MKNYPSFLTIRHPKLLLRGMAIINSMQVIFQYLETMFQQLSPLGIRIPSSQNLADRVEYLVFQIRTISEIYRLSNLIPGIGGDIYFVSISQVGLHSQGIKHY